MPSTPLPDSVLAAARSAHLTVEGGAVAYFEDHGESAFATVCINHWLHVKDGQILLDIGIAQREPGKQDWEALGSSSSEPLSEAQALQVVNFWCFKSRALERARDAERSQESRRMDAFGPRPPRPWEVEFQESTKQQSTERNAP